MHQPHTFGFKRFVEIDLEFVTELSPGLNPETSVENIAFELPQLQELTLKGLHFLRLFGQFIHDNVMQAVRS